MTIPPYTPMAANPPAPYSQTNVMGALAKANQAGQTLSKQIQYQNNQQPYSPWQRQNEFNVLMWNATQRLAEENQHLQRYVGQASQRPTPPTTGGHIGINIYG